LVRIEKIFSNSSPSQVAIYSNLGKIDSARAYMRATIRDASFPIEEVEGYKDIFVFRRVPNLSSEEVEG
jgi:hypothetical protein